MPTDQKVNLNFELCDIHPCGWDICFYMMGTCSMLWTVAWVFLAYDNPRSHPNITEEVPFYPNFMTSPRYLKPLTYISAPNLLLQIKPTQVKSSHRSLRNWTRSLLAQRRRLFLGARWQPRRQSGGSYSPTPQIHLVCALASECPKV